MNSNDSSQNSASISGDDPSANLTGTPATTTTAHSADGLHGQALVLRLQDAHQSSLVQLLDRYGLKLVIDDSGKDIPGSFWGDDEAGLIGNELWARPDTPVHSILHESCHYICMDQERRGGLHTNAGGDYDEENAVCYLQILLADQIEGFGRKAMFEDMDRWGYSFRLGSAQAWFERDAQDACRRLVSDGIIDQNHQPSWQVRTI